MSDDSDWSETELGEMGANTTDIEPSTKCKILRKRLGESGYDHQLSRHTSLGIENEKHLITVLKNFKKHGYLLYGKLVRRVAYVYAKKMGIMYNFFQKNGMASEVWLRSFMTRYPSLEVRKGVKINITDEKIDKMIRDCFVNDEKHFPKLCGKPRRERSKSSDGPSMPQCKEEITIEENEIGVEISNDSETERITEADVELYILHLTGENVTKKQDVSYYLNEASGSKTPLTNLLNRNRIKIVPFVPTVPIVDDFDNFAEFIAPELRGMKSPEDQLKMMNNIMELFEKSKS